MLGLLLLLGGARAVMDAGDGQNWRAAGDTPSGWRPMVMAASLENGVSYKEYFGIDRPEAPSTPQEYTRQHAQQERQQAGAGRGEYGGGGDMPVSYEEMAELVKENLTMGVVVSIHI
jgi:hypothetical protein